MKDNKCGDRRIGCPNSIFKFLEKNGFQLDHVVQSIRYYIVLCVCVCICVRQPVDAWELTVGSHFLYFPLSHNPPLLLFLYLFSFPRFPFLAVFLFLFLSFSFSFYIFLSNIFFLSFSFYCFLSVFLYLFLSMFIFLSSFPFPSTSPSLFSFFYHIFIYFSSFFLYPHSLYTFLPPPDLPPSV